MKKILLVSLLALTLAATAFYVEIKSRTFQFFGNIISCVSTHEKVIALTFDDGPSIHTEEILKVLQENEIKATFFLIGSELEAHMQYGKQLVEAGEEIGNHSYSHTRLIFKSYSTITSEIETTDSLIRLAGYKNIVFFRPPYCKKFIFLPYYLNQHHRTTINLSSV